MESAGLTALPSSHTYSLRSQSSHSDDASSILPESQESCMKTLVDFQMLPSPSQDADKLLNTTKALFRANQQISELHEEISHLKDELLAVTLKNDLLTPIVMPLTSSPMPCSLSQPTGARFSPTDNLFGHGDVYLFSGAYNPLSAFFHSRILWEGKTYISVEQAYQYAKLKFHRTSLKGLNEMSRAKTSYECKKRARKWIPNCSPEWDHVKFDVMEKLCFAKAQQCRKFKDILCASGTKHLIHNIDTDPVWGCGSDGKGLNMMGIILMSVRAALKDYEKDFPPLQSFQDLMTEKIPTKQTQTSSITMRSDKRPISIAVGNSNIRGLSAGLQDRGVESCAFVYPGQTIRQITSRVKHISSRNLEPNAVICHAGDIEVRHSQLINDIIRDYEQLMHELRNNFPRACVIVSGLPQVSSLQNHDLHEKIEDFNKQLEGLCSQRTATYFQSNSDAKLRDSIHFSSQSLNILSKKIANQVKQFI